MQKTEMSPDASLRITLEFKGTEKPTIIEMLDPLEDNMIYGLDFETPCKDGQAYTRLTKQLRKVRRIL